MSTVFVNRKCYYIVYRYSVADATNPLQSLGIFSFAAIFFFTPTSALVF